MDDMSEGNRAAAGPPAPLQGEGAKKKRLGTGWKVAIVIVAVILLMAAAGGIYSLVFITKSHAVKVGNIDLGAVDDGTYQARYGVLHVQATVRVTVKDHRITKIDVVKEPSGGEEQVPEVIKRVVAEQSLQVDTVTGASTPTSTKVTLKAIEKALESSQ